MRGYVICQSLCRSWLQGGLSACSACSATMLAVTPACLQPWQVLAPEQSLHAGPKGCARELPVAVRPGAGFVIH